MSSELLLQIFLYANVLVIGVLLTIAVQHAYAHFHPHPHETEKPHAAQPAIRLTPEARERLLTAAENNYRTILTRSAEELQQSLQATSKQLTTGLDTTATKILTSQMETYRLDIETLRKQAEESISGSLASVAEQQVQLKAQLEADIAAEKAQLLAQIDNRLADTVASFLTETLRHNVDLGAQTPYLTALLEEHKADFAEGLTPAKGEAK